MAFNAIQFPAPQNQGGIFENAARQYQGMVTPNILNQQMRQGDLDIANSQAANFIKDLEAQYKEKQILQDLEHKHAVALNQQRMGAGIGLGRGVTASQKQYAPSAVGKLLNEQESVIATYGEDSPQAAIMKAAIEKATMSGNLKSGGYAPSNIGKLMRERETAIEMYGPESEQAKIYDLQIQKTTTDSNTRTRSLLAANLEKSMNALNSDDIVRYSGPQGAVKLKKEQTMDLAGHPSEEYLKYKEAQVAAEFEASELRQFFGDSITPEAKNHIRMLTNPSTLSKSPEAAKRQLEKSRAIVRKQLETFRGGLKSTKEHTGKSSASEPQEFSEEDILYMAEKYGKTPEEVRQDIGM